MGLEPACTARANFEGEAGVIVGVAHGPTFGKGAPGHFPDSAVFPFDAIRFGKEFRKFKVDEAESSKTGTVGDIAGFRVIVAHAILPLKVGEKGIGLGARDLGSGLSAVGGDDVILFRQMLQQTRDIGTATLLKSLEESRFVLTAPALLVAPELLVHMPLEVDADVGANTVLEILHAGGSEGWGRGKGKVKIQGGIDEQRGTESEMAQSLETFSFDF